MPAKKRAASPHPEERPAKIQNTKGSSPTRHVESATLPLTSKLRVKRLNEHAQLPTRGSILAAGYDLYSAEEKVVPASGKALIGTGLSLAVPVGTYGRVAPRSGLATKFMIDTGAGVVDADYRGQLFVLLFNHSKADFKITVGDRIAQLVLERIMTPPVLEVDNLEETLRGTNGFGSTGGHVGL